MPSPDIIIAALRKRAGYEAVSQNETATQLRFLGRLLPDRGGQGADNWKTLMHFLNAAMKERTWTVDISKYFFNKEETGLLVFAWRIIFQGENLAQHYTDIANVIAKAPNAARELTEMPLAGATADRNSTAGGKRGAGAFGKVLVGPMAVHQKNMGG